MFNEKVVQKTCTKCGESYPIKDFKRRLSKRQSASLLRRESVRIAITVISSRCRFCWHDAKRKTPLTTKQIKQKRASGDMHETVADILLTQRKQNATAVKSRIMKEYWEKKRAEPIQQLTKNLRQQVAKYKNRYHATKAQNPHHALLRQHRENYEQAKQVRNDLLSRARSGESISPDVLIDVYFRRIDVSD